MLFQLFDILEKANYGASEKIGGCHGLEGGRDEQLECRGYVDVRIFSY